MAFSKKPSSINEVFWSLKELWRHLTKRRKKHIVMLCLLMIAGGLSEAISLGLVVPFLAALAAPEKIMSYSLVHKALHIISNVFSLLEIGKYNLGLILSNPIPLLALMFAMAAVVAGSIRLSLLWATIRLTHAVQEDLGLKIYRHILKQPYAFHINQNSSSLISNLITNIAYTGLTCSCALTIISSLVFIISIIFVLSVINFGATLVAGLVLGLSYVILTMVARPRLLHHSQIIAREQSQTIKVLQEGLGGIRDILLDGTQEAFCKIYENSNALLKNSGAKNSAIIQSPRYILETVALVLFAVLAVLLNRKNEGLLVAIPVLGALAFGAQRLLPALQLGYSAWTSILGNYSSLKSIIILLNQPTHEKQNDNNAVVLPFTTKIKFDRVSYKYSTYGPWILKDLSFKIPRGSRVGIVGKTGSGKSTTLDLLMGLLNPTGGKIVVDDTILTLRNIRAWQRNIAHVPQTIYLSDSTFAENIAFGVPLDKINMAQVREAARQAKIADFIESSPLGYSALVGERGIKLSGGQRQRIGIARAIYKQAEVLIFDEATSALDQDTERKVMKEINQIKSSCTIIIISHRVSTLKHCSQIIDLDIINRGMPCVNAKVSDTKKKALHHFEKNRT